MDSLVSALGPAFAAGFAIQQLLELLDPALDRISKDWKKIVLGIVALVVGFALAIGPEIRVLAPLGITDADTWDIIVTALVVSAGTQGANSIMKFLGYTKEAKKGDAAEKREEAKLSDVPDLDRV
jgi:hypothetical protein